MHPLVSGHEAKRYQIPLTSTYLLFPYEVKNGRVQLYTEKEMETRFPMAWTYLKRYEKELRERENCKMDKDDSWWAYNYPKNLDKQEIPKLCVAQTVPGMRVCFDAKGEFYFNNVRVNSILPDNISNGWYLLGIMNNPVCDYIFKLIAKPKASGYFEANKQFIAPLPVPPANGAEKSQVAEKAKHLQKLHTRRRDLMLAIDKRLDSAQCENDKRDESWLWAEVKPLSEIKKNAPGELNSRETASWAKDIQEAKLSNRIEAIDSMLYPGIKLTVVNENGELKLLSNGMCLLEGIFLDENEADFIAAQWRQKIRRTNITMNFDAKRLISQILKLRKTANDAINTQTVSLDAEIQALDAEIAEAESDINRLIYRLYSLTESEIKLVEGQ